MTEVEILESAIQQLQHWWTPRGVITWLDRPHPELRWRTPLEAIKDGDGLEVVELAEAGRGMILS